MRLTAFQKSLCFGLLFLAINAHSFGQVQLTGDKYEIPFSWQVDTSNGFVEPHAAMLIPVKLPGCAKQFYMQFDMGAPKTVFYNPVCNLIGKKYPGVISITDTSRNIAEIVIKPGKQSIQLQNVALMNTGAKNIDWSNNASIIIGTIGSDWLQNRTVMINYPKKRIVLNYEVPENYKESMTDFTYVQNSILLPVTINGKKTVLFFDTGSSAFSLLTSKETALAMADKDATALRYPVQSWGRTMYANSLPSSDSIEINKLKIPLEKVTYMEGASESQVNRMLQLGIGGMTGNKLFFKHRLILDTRGKKFMVIK